MSPANCFSLLQLGRRQGLHHVERRALRAALSCFPQAVRLDRAGFESLPEEVGVCSTYLNLSYSTCLALHTPCKHSSLSSSSGCPAACMATARRNSDFWCPWC